MCVLLTNYIRCVLTGGVSTHLDDAGAVSGELPVVEGTHPDGHLHRRHLARSAITGSGSFNRWTAH